MNENRIKALKELLESHEEELYAGTDYHGQIPEIQHEGCACGHTGTDRALHLAEVIVEAGL